MSLGNRKILQGSAANVTRVLLSVPFAVILPPLFVHYMAPPEYSAWMLILQGAAYVGLLDLGLQTAVNKFVAQFDAAGDRIASGRILSCSFAILCVSSLIGAVVVAIITWRVPDLFDQMPVALISSMRTGVLLVGLSTALALPSNAFLSTFAGLQRYGFPTALAILSKTITSAILIGFIMLHATIVQLAALIAASNVATALIQILGWKRFVKDRVSFSLKLIDRETVLQLARYGGMLSVWTVAMLFVSGLDMVIVGHYDYSNTAYYGTATTVINFMLLILISLFGPLLPAVSSLNAATSSLQIGQMVITATRLCVLFLCLVGLPISLGAFPLLKLWVGSSYATRSAPFLELLLLGIVIRQLCYPYALAIVATGKQHLASVAAISEALVNVAVSIYLVQRIGALGVAIGTVIGALVSVSVHIAISMRLSRSIVSLSRRQFVIEGICRPLTCVIPCLLFLPFWKSSSMTPFSPLLMSILIVSTFGTAFFLVLTPPERSGFKRRVIALMREPLSRDKRQNKDNG